MHLGVHDRRPGVFERHVGEREQARVLARAAPGPAGDVGDHPLVVDPQPRTSEESLLDRPLAALLGSEPADFVEVPGVALAAEGRRASRAQLVDAGQEVRRQERVEGEDRRQARIDVGAGLGQRAVGLSTAFAGNAERSMAAAAARFPRSIPSLSPSPSGTPARETTSASSKVFCCSGRRPRQVCGRRPSRRRRKRPPAQPAARGTRRTVVRCCWWPRTGRARPGPGGGRWRRCVEPRRGPPSDSRRALGHLHPGGNGVRESWRRSEGQGRGQGDAERDPILPVRGRFSARMGFTSGRFLT